MLREKKYTIEGAKRILEEYEQNKKPMIEIKEKKTEPETEEVVETEKNDVSLKEDLEEIRSVLRVLLSKL